LMDEALRLSLCPAREASPALTGCELETLSHWYGDTPEDIEAAYGAYLDQTAFLSVVVTETDQVIGFARLIAPGALPAKTLVDLARPPWGLDVARSIAAAGIEVAGTWDIATLGVRPGLPHGRAMAAVAVYHGVLATLRVNQVTSLVAIVDQRVRRLLAAVGLSCQTLPGAAPALYMGSPACVPVYAHVAATLDEQRRRDPDAYRLITIGSGLGEASVAASQVLRWKPPEPAAPPLRPDRIRVAAATEDVLALDLSEVERSTVDLRRAETSDAQPPEVDLSDGGSVGGGRLSSV
jgi:hypothetical protein